MLPDFPPNTVVKFTGSALAHHRKLSAHGKSGVAFADDHLTAAEGAGVFVWLGTPGDGRDAHVRSTVSEREGFLFRGFFRVATRAEQAR